MKLQIFLVISLLSLPALGETPHKSQKPAVKPAKIVRVEKAQHRDKTPAVKPKRGERAMQMEEAVIETAPEQAQKPVEAKKSPGRASLIQPKTNFNGAILQSGSSL